MYSILYSYNKVNPKRKYYENHKEKYIYNTVFIEKNQTHVVQMSTLVVFFVKTYIKYIHTLKF